MALMRETMTVDPVKVGDEAVGVARGKRRLCSFVGLDFPRKFFSCFLPCNGLHGVFPLFVCMYSLRCVTYMVPPIFWYIIILDFTNISQTFLQSYVSPFSFAPFLSSVSWG